MSAMLTSLLAVTLLLEPPAVRPAPVVGTPTVRSGETPAVRPSSARITSRTSDFDATAGVVMFEGDVCARYSDEFTMCADRLYMFFSGTNELHRVVAVGAVSITNESRVGTCAMATYRRQKGEIEMFGDGKESLVRLCDGGGNASSLEGTRIKFWIGAEQAEVENSRITSEGKDGRKLL